MLGKAISLAIRGRKAAALRLLLVDEMKDKRRPVIVLGDLNDSGSRVTAEVITGLVSWRVGQPVWTADHGPVLVSIRFHG